MNERKQNWNHAYGTNMPWPTPKVTDAGQLSPPMVRRWGWLWVTPAEAGMPSDSVFLYQILVKPASRRQGYGRAMLAALEEALTADGIVEVRLNVFDTNQRAKALYAGAGYEFIKSLKGRSQLGKRFALKDPNH